MESFPYEPLTTSPTSFRCPSWCAPKKREDGGWLTHKLLEDKAHDLKMQQLGAEHDMKVIGLEAAKAKREGNAAMQRSCAQRMVNHKRRHEKFVQMWTNLDVLKTQLEDTTLCTSFAKALGAANMSLDQALEQIQYDDIDRLLDCLRDQGQRLDEVQTFLSEPIAMNHVELGEIQLEEPGETEELREVEPKNVEKIEKMALFE